MVNVIIFSLLSGLAMVSGIYLVRYYSAWAQNKSVYLISFAAGILLANAFLHLLPESIKLTQSWAYWALGTIIIFYLIEHAISIHGCREEGCEVHAIGRIGLVGIGFHSLVDGIVIGIAFQVSFSIGLAAFLAITFHKIAEGVCIYSLLIHDRIAAKKALFHSWLVSLATPIGAILAAFFLRQASGAMEGWLLAAAAGSFIYIGASDLIPATHKKQSFFNIILLLVGIVFVLVTGFWSE